MIGGAGRLAGRGLGMMGGECVGRAACAGWRTSPASWYFDSYDGEEALVCDLDGDELGCTSLGEGGDSKFVRQD
jgi:hypothetical protein